MDRREQKAKARHGGKDFRDRQRLYRERSIGVKKPMKVKGR